MKTQKTQIPLSKQIAYTAVMCALLISGQYVFNFVAGVEIVTVLLISFAAVFGVKCGVLCAVAFSLLRCFIFGFYPNIIILYLIYYPLFAASFGALGKIKTCNFTRICFAVAVNLLLAAMCAACLWAYFTDAIITSRLLRNTFNVLLWIIAALCFALIAVFDALFIANRLFKKNTATALRLVTFCCLAAVFTVFFTALDDILTPLMSGFSKEAWLTYFYGSFAAMLPQTVCAIMTVATVFLPLEHILSRFSSV